MPFVQRRGAGDEARLATKLRRIRFTVAYDGTDFNGWQVQPGLPTIQGTLEEIISGMEGKPVHVAASGRTDAGVHALGQVAAITISNPIPADNFRRALNRLLPTSIRIFDVVDTHADFHPRFDAVRKTYEYRILREEICPPFIRNYVYHHPYPLDEIKMMQAAPEIEGEHDFTAFAAADDRGTVSGSKIRQVSHSSLERNTGMLIYRVTGSGFLKHMVRNIVGILLEIGKCNLSVAELRERLQPVCSLRPGHTAPARGLWLISVEYE